MKSTGIVRKLDELGRITLPMELRRTMDINDGDPIEISVDEDRIILEKYEGPTCSCSFCGRSEGVDLKELDGKKVCNICAMHIRKMFSL